MFCRPCRTLALAALLLLPAHALAAPFPLPGDAVIAVRAFTFPATPDGAPERDLPAAFQAQLTVALQQAGFSVSREESAVRPASPDGPLIVTPLQEASLREESPQGEPQQDAPDTDDSPSPPESSDTPGAVAEDTEAVTEPPLAEPETPATGRATHILEGEVALFRETVGAPSRIAGNIRIRVEARLRCAYTIKNAATGKTLITDAASGNAARIVPESGEYDAVLESLRSRALTAAAETIAARVAGTGSPGDSAAPDRSYYQDSPGKRLKPRQ